MKRRDRIASAVLLAFASVLLLLALAHRAEAKARKVVIVPGILGSKLCDANGAVLWGDRLSYTAARLTALRLPPDPANREMSIHSCGLIETVNVVPLLWQSHIYAPLLSFLKLRGYEGPNVIIAHYDWRLSNYESAKRLKAAIDASVAPGETVDVLAHSMGGLVTRIYMQELGGSARINSVTFLGTPHRGSAKVFRELRDGFEHWPSGLSGGLDAIKATILSFPSTYQLLPTYDSCCAFAATVDPTGATYFDVLDPAAWTRFTWLPPSFRTGPDQAGLITKLEEARRLRQLMVSESIPNVDSARVHYVANGFLDTWSRVYFHPTTGQIVGNSSSPGDGTVLLYSATGGVPARFQLSLREHESVFSGREAELLMQAVLSSTNWTAARSNFVQTIVDRAGARFPVTSAALHVAPRLVEPGGEARIVFSLSGDETLSRADLQNVTCEIFKDTEIIGRSAIVISHPQATEVRLEARVRLPMSSGAYLARVTVPGLDIMETSLAVMAP